MCPRGGVGWAEPRRGAGGLVHRRRSRAYSVPVSRCCPRLSPPTALPPQHSSPRLPPLLYLSSPSVSAVGMDRLKHGHVIDDDGAASSLNETAELRQMELTFTQWLRKQCKSRNKDLKLQLRDLSRNTTRHRKARTARLQGILKQLEASTGAAPEEPSTRPTDPSMIINAPLMSLVIARWSLTSVTASGRPSTRAACPAQCSIRPSGACRARWPISSSRRPRQPCAPAPSASPSRMRIKRRACKGGGSSARLTARTLPAYG